jgi:ABC-type polysaccharide/polyol phosphate transport system ATPase subunit
MEVGSAVHPELTGRENIWLYGQILGMSKATILKLATELAKELAIARLVSSATL